MMTATKSHMVRIRADHWEWASKLAERLGTTPTHALKMAISHGQAALDALVQPRPSMQVHDISDTAEGLLRAAAEVRAART